MTTLWIFNAVFWAVVAIVELWQLWLYDGKLKSKTLRAILLSVLFVLLALKESNQ